VPIFHHLGEAPVLAGLAPGAAVTPAEPNPAPTGRHSAFLVRSPALGARLVAQNRENASAALVGPLPALPKRQSGPKFGESSDLTRSYPDFYGDGLSGIFATGWRPSKQRVLPT
jgi:hypothetical protein